MQSSPNLKLARMEKVDLRDVWTREAEDFTPWLANDENIRLLGQALGLDMEVQQQEVGVGPYRADILCKEADEDRVVVIENQIEETDHSHLGQLLTYAAGLRASIVVWVAKSFTNEHRAALDWLNENSNGKISFFGVEIEVWKIADSPPAPQFHVVCQPNEWTEQMKEVVRISELTETRQLCGRYWADLVAYLKATGSSIQCKEPGPNTRLWAQCPIPGFRCGFETVVKGKYLYGYVGTRAAESVEIMRRVRETQKDDLEKDLGATTYWDEYSQGQSIWVSIARQADPSDTKDWPRQHEWMKTSLEKLIAVLTKYVSGAESKQK